MQLPRPLHRPADILRIAMARLYDSDLTERAALAVALAALVFAAEPMGSRFGPAASEAVLRLAYGLWDHLTHTRY